MPPWPLPEPLACRVRVPEAGGGPDIRQMTSLPCLHVGPSRSRVCNLPGDSGVGCLVSLAHSTRVALALVSHDDQLDLHRERWVVAGWGWPGWRLLQDLGLLGISNAPHRSCKEAYSLLRGRGSGGLGPVPAPLGGVLSPQGGESRPGLALQGLSSAVLPEAVRGPLGTCSVWRCSWPGSETTRMGPG